MSDLVSFIRNDVVSKHYEFHLLHRLFKKWKFSTSKYNILPSSNGILITACFMWMRCSFSNQIIDEVPQHLFPFYAAVEEDGEDSAYFISRLRSYMIDKLELPPHNLPLLAHAVAMFDAVQLSKCFTAWQIHYYQCRKMDEIALKNTRKRSIRWWKYKTNVRIAIRLRSNILLIDPFGILPAKA